MPNSKKHEPSLAVPLKSDSGVYRRLLGYVLPYWMAFLVSILGYLIFSFSNVAFVQLISYIVDSLQGNDPLQEGRYANILSGLLGSAESLNRTIIPVAIGFLVVMRGIGTFVGDTFIAYVATNLVHDLRRQLFNQMMHLPTSFLILANKAILLPRLPFM